MAEAQRNVEEYVTRRVVPAVLQQTMRKILREGLETEGLFRVPGNRCARQSGNPTFDVIGSADPRPRDCSGNVVRVKDQFDAGKKVDLTVRARGPALKQDLAANFNPRLTFFLAAAERAHR